MSPPAAAQALRDYTAENRSSIPTTVDPSWVVADKPLPPRPPAGGDNAAADEVSANSIANSPREVPRAVLLNRYAVSLPTPVFEVRQQWEGTVRAVSESDFVAVLADLSDTSRGREQAVFSLDEVPDEDHELVVPGSVFYWSIGYERGRGGQKKSTSVIRFRRLPAWTARELDAVRSEAREMLSDFGSEDAETRTARSR